MAVWQLIRPLANWVEVTIKDHKTGETLFVGCASEAGFNDDVKGYDFGEEHIIYI